MLDKYFPLYVFVFFLTVILTAVIEKKFIPKNSEELVYIDELEAFFSSTLFDKISCAKRVIREQRFNILLSPSILNDNADFLRETDGEFLAVQGVMDLIIEDENGDISVYDYKTDRVSQEEMINSELLQKKMIERHSKQLSYYNEAIKRLFSRECKHLAVYSTCAAKEIEIPQN